MLSIGAMLYLTARTLPRVTLEPEADEKGLFEKWITSEVPEKIDKALNGFFFKSMKKMRVLLLRFDNTLGERIKKISHEANETAKHKQLDFKAITEQHSPTEGKDVAE